MPGKVPNGCVESNSCQRTDAASGRCGVTTTVATRGTKSVTATRKKMTADPKSRQVENQSQASLEQVSGKSRAGLRQVRLVFDSPETCSRLGLTCPRLV